MATNMRVFLQYPCGKRWELRVPITITELDGKIFTILPTDKDYIQHARKRFEINNLKVVEIEMEMKNTILPSHSFISLVRKKTATE